jgi:molecular chaperone HscB
VFSRQPQGSFDSAQDDNMQGGVEQEYQLRPCESFAMPENTAQSALPIVSNRETAACWSCGSMRAAHYCQSCGKVQPATPVDYFSFFGLTRKLNLDVAALERDFYALSRKLHPDLFAQSSEAEQRQWSLEKSSQLNDAYRTLKDPIARTEYLLHLEGINLDEQSTRATEIARSSGQTKKQVVPPDMLEDVFELNMQIEELRMNQKMGAQDPELVEQLGEHKKSLQQKLTAVDQELRTGWTAWDALVDSGSEASEAAKAAINQLVDALNRRSYIRNLVRDVNEALES